MTQHDRNGRGFVTMHGAMAQVRPETSRRLGSAMIAAAAVALLTPPGYFLIGLSLCLMIAASSFALIGALMALPLKPDRLCLWDEAAFLVCLSGVCKFLG